jgi:hypothetical protein
MVAMKLTMSQPVARKRARVNMGNYSYGKNLDMDQKEGAQYDGAAP